jgi:hypothetical protein
LKEEDRERKTRIRSARVRRGGAGETETWRLSRALPTAFNTSIDDFPTHTTLDSHPQFLELRTESRVFICVLSSSTLNTHKYTHIHDTTAAKGREGEGEQERGREGGQTLQSIALRASSLKSTSDLLNIHSHVHSLSLKFLPLGCGS